MESSQLKIAVGKDKYYMWHERFQKALFQKQRQGYPIDVEVVDLEHHDWINKIEAFDVVIWKPNYLGVEASATLKEKIYFLERYLNKIVVPNYETVWHFESKIAQSYIFEKSRIPTPKTFVSFDYHDAVSQLSEISLPIVYKKSHGAGSKNVRLVKSKSKFRKHLSSVFFHQLWKEGCSKYGLSFEFFFRSFLQKWFWCKIVSLIFGSNKYRSVYWQEFISGNDSDLRITAIGDRYAFGFWRNNRPNDFRASGSGNIDYQKEVPEELIQFCLDINRKFNFDSMAYDLIFKENKCVVVEMSYGYIDSAIYNSQGYFRKDDNGRCSFIEGHFWPQELWVEWALIRAHADIF